MKTTGKLSVQGCLQHTDKTRSRKQMCYRKSLRSCNSLISLSLDPVLIQLQKFRSSLMVTVTV